MRVPILALAGPAALTACLAGCVETAPPAVPPGVEDTCGMAPAERFIGVDVAALSLLQRTGPTRVIGPDQPVTMDYNPERLNVFTTASGLIDRLTCG